MSFPIPDHSRGQARSGIQRYQEIDTGFPLEFTLVKTGAGMTGLLKSIHADFRFFLGGFHQVLRDFA